METKDRNEILKEFIKDNWRVTMKEPSGALKYKFLDPAAVYRGQLWDWDSFFCGLALIDVYDDAAEYIKGCVMNFFDHMRKDGSIPYVIEAREGLMEAIPGSAIEERDENCDINSMKPLLAQMMVLAGKKCEDKSWITDNYDKLEKHIAHWEATQKRENGLFVWRSYRGSGTDNHPALYGRPLNSSAGVELNCLMYKEFLAMEELKKMCNISSATDYEKKAAELAESINKYMWDPIDGLYYHQDMLSAKPPLAHQAITWQVPLKFRTWTCFMPMWAGIAPDEYAQRLVEHMMNPAEFYSDYGLRTLSANEPTYSTWEGSNPSNWQGPIWIVSTYLMYMGLRNYGYNNEAKKISDNLINMLVNDIQTNGCMHEYYNPETGISNINAGFMNWNALSALML